MSGAIMPAPLAKPLIVTSTPAIVARSGRELRIGVGGHDGARGVQPAVGPRLLREFLQHAIEFMRVERFADDPRGRQKNLALGRAGRRGGELRREFDRLRAGLAGEGVGVSGIDEQRARLAALEPVAAPVHRRRGTFGFGEDARDRRSRDRATPASHRCVRRSARRRRRRRSERPRAAGFRARISARAARRGRREPLRSPVNRSGSARMCPALQVARQG